MADQDDGILNRMMESNRSWADKVNQENPGFFDRLAKQQTPRVLPDRNARIDVDGEGAAESTLDAAIARPPLGLRSA